MKRRLALILLTALVSIFGAVACGGAEQKEEETTQPAQETTQEASQTQQRIEQLEQRMEQLEQRMGQLEQQAELQEQQVEQQLEELEQQVEQQQTPPALEGPPGSPKGFDPREVEPGGVQERRP